MRLEPTLEQRRACANKARSNEKGPLQAAALSHVSLAGAGETVMDIPVPMRQTRMGSGN